MTSIVDASSPDKSSGRKDKHSAPNSCAISAISVELVETITLEKIMQELDIVLMKLKLKLLMYMLIGRQQKMVGIYK